MSGFFTIIAAQFVVRDVGCVAFDPSPENYASIRKQIDLNQLKQGTTAQEGSAPFSFASHGSSMGHLGERDESETQLEVKVTTHFDDKGIGADEISTKRV